MQFEKSHKQCKNQKDTKAFFKHAFKTVHKFDFTNVQVPTQEFSEKICQGNISYKKTINAISFKPDIDKLILN